MMDPIVRPETLLLKSRPAKRCGGRKDTSNKKKRRAERYWTRKDMGAARLVDDVGNHPGFAEFTHIFGTDDEVAVDCRLVCITRLALPPLHTPARGPFFRPRSTRTTTSTRPSSERRVDLFWTLRCRDRRTEVLPNVIGRVLLGGQPSCLKPELSLVVSEAAEKWSSEAVPALGGPVGRCGGGMRTVLTAHQDLHVDPRTGPVASLFVPGRSGPPVRP
jgi:hypothetical protein